MPQSDYHKVPFMNFSLLTQQSRTRNPKYLEKYYFTKLSDAISALLRCYAAYIGSYRRFGTTYRSHLHGQTNCFSWTIWLLKIGQIGVSETSVSISLNCVISQKSKGLTDTVAEAWNKASCQLLTSQSVGAGLMNETRGRTNFGMPEIRTRKKPKNHFVQNNSHMHCSGTDLGYVEWNSVTASKNNHFECNSVLFVSYYSEFVC